MAGTASLIRHVMVAAVVAWTPGAATADATQATAPSPARALLNKYCVTCHNARLKTGGLMLDAVNVDDVSASPEIWEKVVGKLRSGVMPPIGQPRPEARAVTQLATTLERALDR